MRGTWGNLSGSRADFNTMNTGDVFCGVTALFKLPKDFQIGTDLNLYARYGYADPLMNTHDWVCNARVSKSLMQGNLTFLIDGFDLLHKLSNVTQTINEQGRTESYRNVIPSYFMAHAIYRLNVKPKKRPGD